MVTVRFDFEGSGGGSCGDTVSSTSSIGGIGVDTITGDREGIGGEGGASGNFFRNDAVMAVCEGSFDK